MKHILHMMHILVVVVCFIMPAMAEENRQYSSDNGEYIAEVRYDGEYGAGNGYYTITDKQGNILDTFKTDVAPMYLYVANNGKYMVALGGNWKHDVYYDKILFYTIKGDIIKKYFLKMPYITVIQNYSPDGNIWALALNYDFKEYITHLDRNKKIYKECIVLFDPSTGEVLEQISVDGLRVRDMRVTNNADWILISGHDYKKNKFMVMLINRKGNIIWVSKSTKLMEDGTLEISNIAPDGKTFELHCRYKNKSVKTYNYTNNKGKIKLIKTSKSVNKE